MIKVSFNGNFYNAELVSNQVWDKKRENKGHLYRITDTEDEKNACISVFFDRTTRAVWRNHRESETISDNEIEGIISTILPHINIPESIENIKAIYDNPLQLLVHQEETFYKPDAKILYLNGETSPERLVHQVLFGGKPEEDKLKREILEILNEDRLAGKDHTNTVELSKQLYISQEKINITLKLLEEEGKIDIPVKSLDRKIPLARIKANGVKYIDRNFQEIYQTVEIKIINMGDQFNVKGDLVKGDKHIGDVIHGDKYENKTSGDNSPVNQPVIKPTETKNEKEWYEKPLGILFLSILGILIATIIGLYITNSIHLTAWPSQTEKLIPIHKSTAN